MKKLKSESEYSKLLRTSPLWQKTRARILERDQCKCVECGDSDGYLYVHHAYYVKGRKPWMYPDWSLSSLCKKCHDAAHRDLSGDYEDYHPGQGEFEWETALGFIIGKDPMDCPFSSMLWDIGVEISQLRTETGRSKESILTDILFMLNEQRKAVQS